MSQEVNLIIVKRGFFPLGSSDKGKNNDFLQNFTIKE